MILINKSLCCTNLRKAGIIYSSINLTIRAIAMIVLIVFAAINGSNQHYYSSYSSYSDGSHSYSSYSGSHLYDYRAGIYATGLFFVGLYMMLYGFLIYGLSSLKPSYLMLWLIFAPFEIIIFQVLLLILDSVAMPAPAGIAVLALNLHLAITVFMFHNVCLVFTVRHNFISNRNGQNRNLVQPLGNATVITTNPSTEPSVNQYTQNNPTSSYYVTREGTFPYPPTCPQTEARPLI